MMLSAFSIQSGLSRTGIVLPASLTNLVLQSFLVSLRQGTRARRIGCLTSLEHINQQKETKL
jgi:hypothetical protein